MLNITDWSAFEGQAQLNFHKQLNTYLQSIFDMIELSRGELEKGAESQKRGKRTLEDLGAGIIKFGWIV